MRPLLVALIVIAVFVPITAADFLYWDDDALLLRTTEWQTSRFLTWALTTNTLGHWMPLTWLSLSLDYALWGMNPLGYHLTSVLLHAASAVLVVLIAQALGVSPLGSMLTALAWALHPLRVESVAWVTERRDVLMGVFYLASLLLWLRGRRHWAVAAFGGALLSKSLAVSLPLVLVAIDAFRVRRLLWRDKLSFFAAAGLASVIALTVIPRGVMLSIDTMSVPERAGVAVYGVGFYLAKWLLPMGLSPLYELPRDLTPLMPWMALSAGVLLAITIAAWGQRRARPALLAAWTASLVMLAPVSGLLQNGPQIAADRYTYLASIPWTLLAGGWLGREIGA